METVDIYTDGSCLGNPGPGGWSFIIRYKNGKIKESSGSKKNTTNNRMELIAAIEAIKYFKKKTKINIYTDSKYLENGITILHYSIILGIRKQKKFGYQENERFKKYKRKKLFNQSSCISTL